MDSDQNLPFTDSRFVRNSMVLEKIRERLDMYKSKMFFFDRFMIFIVNPLNLSQVTLTFPTSKTSDLLYYGDFVLFLTVENYQTLDDIINFFSTNSGPNLQIVEFNENIPFLFYFRYIEGELFRPGRFSYSFKIYEFLKQNISVSLSGCRVYLEDNQSPSNIDLNKIRLVLKDSNNDILLNKVFQDPSTGCIIKQEDNINPISNFKYFPDNKKVKND